MTDNHTATAILIVAALFAVLGLGQLLRSVVLLARSRRFAVGWEDDAYARTRARGLRARRVSAVSFAAAVAALVLVYVSDH